MSLVEQTAPRVCGELVKALSRPGYPLDPAGSCRSSEFVIEVCRAVSGEGLAAAVYSGAAAVELQMSAAYLFDEVADAPGDDSAADLALAIALLSIGSAAASEASACSADPSGLLHAFHQAYSEACAGQFLDAFLQGQAEATLEDALEATTLKSGGLGRWAAGFAARLSGADAEGVALFERLGLNIFTFAQLVDDLRDACEPGDLSDLAQGKATLPAVFYRRSFDPKVVRDSLEPETRRSYERSAAPLYVAILARAYEERARDTLALLAGSGYRVEGLRRYLEGVHSCAESALSAACAGLVS